MSGDRRIGIVCDKFPLPSQTFVNFQAEILQAEVFTLELTQAMPEPGWAGRVHAIGLKPGEGKLRRWGERVYRRIADTPWRVWCRRDQQRLRSLLAERQVSAVMVEFGQCLIGCASGIFDPRWKVVPHFHGIDLSAYVRDERYVQKLRKALARCPDVIVVNAVMEERLRKIIGYEGRVHFVPYCPNIRRFSRPRREQQGAPQLLFVGRLTQKKGPLELVRSFARYAELGGTGKLTIAGGGMLRRDVEGLVRQSGLQDRIELKGEVSHENAAALMAQADVYVQHSRTPENGDEEGWPVAIAEACCVGLPVISTFHAAIPQQVLDGRSGILVQEGDIEAMARAMLRLGGAPALREEMGRAAREHIQKFCDPNAYRERLEAILQDVGSVVTSVR